MVVDIIQSYTGYNINLIDQYYYKFTIDKKNYITTSSSNLDTQKIKYVYSCGLQIIMIDNDISLLPGLLEVIINIEHVSITKKQSVKFSYGKKIEIKNTDGLYIVRDGFNRKIGMGELKNNILTPLIDLGWYLREGK